MSSRMSERRAAALTAAVEAVYNIFIISIIVALIFIQMSDRVHDVLTGAVLLGIYLDRKVN